MTPKNWRPWQHPTEALDALTAVLSEHWAAAKCSPVELFWSNPLTWRHQLAKVRALTSAPAAEDSSDTLPDLRPC